MKTLWQRKEQAMIHLLSLVSIFASQFWKSILQLGFGVLGFFVCFLFLFFVFYELVPFTSLSHGR